MAKLETVKGINEEHCSILRNECDINSVASLLKAGATPAGRDSLAEAMDVSQSLVVQWIHQADLTRIKGIGREYVGLLDAISVRTLAELKCQIPEDLYQSMEKINGHNGLVRRLPTLEMVTDWIEQANEIAPTIVE